jgi:ring-1,2-phenylacetyl-CoA epoxidase subunit PaaD
MVSIGMLTSEDVFEILDEVKDPEVPVLSVVELGIIREVRVNGSAVTVRITPTYSGCPAMRVIEEDITAALTERGLGPIHLETVYAPAWTTDWLSADAKRKLEGYGIAAPGPAPRDSLVTLTRAPHVQLLRCPYCGSHDTTLQSEFGSTACKSIGYCKACQQPFEGFKAI